MGAEKDVAGIASFKKGPDIKLIPVFVKSRVFHAVFTLFCEIWENGVKIA